MKWSILTRVLFGALVLSASTSSVAASPRPPTWVTKKLPGHTQTSLSTQERGVNPCSPPQLASQHRPWRSLGSGAWLAVPKSYKGGAYQLVVHFHGKDRALRQLTKSKAPYVVVGIDVGLGSGAYLKLLDDPSYLPRLLKQVNGKLTAEYSGTRPRREKLALTSWSAGYGSILRALSRPAMVKNVDAVVLLDGLHTGFENGRLNTRKLEPFAQFARLAAEGKKLMVVGHSSIVPPGYASTTTTANYLIWRMGGKPQDPGDATKFPFGLRLTQKFDAGNFHVRGFSGNAKADHCAQFGVFGSVALPRLSRRWASAK